MVAAVIFILTFLLIGLGVLAFAFGGQGGARRRRGGPGRATPRFVVVSVPIEMPNVAVNPALPDQRSSDVVAAARRTVIGV